MKRLLQWIGRRLAATIVPLLIVGSLVGVLYFGRPPQAQEQAADETWTCSMHPQVRLGKSDRCPLCGMALIPVSQWKSEQARVTERAGLETAPAAYRELFKEIRTVGKVDYNERRLAYITSRIEGRVDRVYADFTGISVKQHDHLVDIYSPELYIAQAELLSALQAFDAAKGDRRFLEVSLDAARTKLRLLGILPEQLEEIEKSRQVTSHLTIYAPIGGVVIEKNIREQQYVKEGDMLYRIAELDPIWLYLDIYEFDLPWIRYGQKVEVTVEAYPGQTFEGTVVFIDPFLNDETRTVKVRVNLKNPDHKLKAAMYASAVIHVQLRPDGTPQPTGLEGKFICPMHPEVVRDAAGDCDICQMDLERVPDLFPPHPAVAPAEGVEPGGEPAEVLSIRKSAVLDTGRRQVVYRKRGDGAFELVDVTIGPLAEARDESGRVVSYYPVLAGLKEGDEVVVSGGFLLDSQRQIEGMPSLLYTEGRSAASLHAGHGGMETSGGGAGRHQH
jgi:Cu(I)/Ag(I) efflux system membrane fusion protein